MKSAVNSALPPALGIANAGRRGALCPELSSWPPAGTGFRHLMKMVNKGCCC